MYPNPVGDPKSYRVPYWNQWRYICYNQILRQMLCQKQNKYIPVYEISMGYVINRQSHFGGALFLYTNATMRNHHLQWQLGLVELVWLRL